MCGGHYYFAGEKRGTSIVWTQRSAILLWGGGLLRGALGVVSGWVVNVQRWEFVMAICVCLQSAGSHPDSPSWAHCGSFRIRPLMHLHSKIMCPPYKPKEESHVTQNIAILYDWDFVITITYFFCGPLYWLPMTFDLIVYNKYFSLFCIRKVSVSPSVDCSVVLERQWSATEHL